MHEIHGMLSEHLEENLEDFSKVNELCMFIDNFFCDIKEEHCEVYDCFIERLKDYVWVISSEEIDYIVENLSRCDGSCGARWNRQECAQLSQQYKMLEKIRSFNYDYWYFALNYAYAVHSTSEKPMTYFIELAMEEILDKNVCIKTKICEMIKKVKKDNLR